jgi:hypothetical protein
MLHVACAILVPLLWGTVNDRTWGTKINC